MNESGPSSSKRGWPAAEECEEHAVWQQFHRMAITDELRNDLIDAEYEASAY